jgi:TolB-like protein/Flp pilus assembly protein TadD
MSFFAELKRRNVIRVAGLYLVAAWLIVQVTSTLLPAFELPGWILRALVLVFAVAFIPTLIFSWVYELTPEGLKRENEVERTESITPQTGRRMDRATFALLALAVGIFAIDRFVLVPRRVATTGDASAPAQAASAAPAVSEKSIAVLPLANGSGDKDQQYFSDGLSENLIVALSQFAGLKVIGRNSAFQFRDSKEDSKTIGARLGVAHLLEGSVQRAGDVVRISAELISAADGSTLWSQRYDRPYKDLFALQDEITTAVAGALKAKLLANAVTPAQNDRPPGGSLEAYNAFLLGKFYSARSNEADFHAAIQQYEAASRLDSRYALAFAELSRTWSGLAAQHMSGAEARDAFTKALTAVTAALQLDPNLAAAHWARGYLLSVGDFDWAGAEAEYRRAEQLAPNDGRAKYELGRVVAQLGRPDEAILLTRAALAIDPLSARWYSWLANYLIATGELEEARQSITKAIALQPLAVTFHYTLTIVEVMSGNPPAALAAAEGEPSNVWKHVAIALARQAGSDRTAADAALKVLIDEQSELGPYQIAEVYGVRKEPDKVFEWLDRAWSVRDPGIGTLLSDALLVAYRDDPRFAAFCKKAGLPTTTTAKVQRIPDAKAG